jgi:hypothetical protein
MPTVIILYFIDKKIQGNNSRETLDFSHTIIEEYYPENINLGTVKK